MWYRRQDHNINPGISVSWSEGQEQTRIKVFKVKLPTTWSKRLNTTPPYITGLDFCSPGQSKVY